MITVVVGHRGTGKTEMMKRLQIYLRDESAEIIDLDESIEEKIGKTIPELFLEHGEAYFRELERQLFLETLQKPHTQMFLVLGAGFDLSVIPENVRVLWVRRNTDLDGRIFLNRPRLNPELSPLEEFHKRAVVREARYRERADEVYLMPEGLFENRHHAMAVEKALLTHNLHDIGGAVTIPAEVFGTEKRWELFKARFLNRGVGLFELRDDLLTFEQIQRVVQEMASERLLYSFRTKPENAEALMQEPLIAVLNRVAWIDWPVELGSPEDLLRVISSDKLILSLHDESRKELWQQFSHQAAHLKYAPMVDTFSDLKKGHEWQQGEPSRRSFLPRSPDGRWEWYRRLQKGHQLINFWREGDGTAGDQPSLWAWMMTPEVVKDFAAVLGDPVRHSFTPLEHSDFFHKKSLPVFAVAISRDEWDQAFPVVQGMGLRYAAVTSPHKENAAKVCKHENLKAVNTLFWNEKTKSWQGTSTDDQGFMELIEGVGMIAPLQKEIFVWGGGGVLEMIEKALPHASFISSRTGKPRAGSEDAETLLPKIVIWAAPRGPETQMPPAHWNPAMVFDLNYKEDSMGREYAQRCGANYQSGLVMFTAQAQGQRMFWRKSEENA
ncbi:Shikimate dehydrogenase (NADP(+)) [Bdellovibrio bacteriovorus]|uniref:shikimate kinase n=1 Tax=Bdellovibrio bacteriovorus TaxID=959 RepID=UPI00045BF430|nr:shikimate kinase [Bdellovibrio bacteriovorus]AHZ83846.1 shikimate synthase [Bdellovibrio bacteriovorus]BEV69820.1 Shikimate dehydrogenase (NADP(+)) [Bdellovibrio bacteriovorus]